MAHRNVGHPGGRTLPRDRLVSDLILRRQLLSPGWPAVRRTMTKKLTQCHGPPKCGPPRWAHTAEGPIGLRLNFKTATIVTWMARSPADHDKEANSVSWPTEVWATQLGAHCRGTD